MGSSVILPPPGQPVQGPDPSFQSASQPLFIGWNMDHADPPAPLYVTLNDVIEVDVYNSQPNQNVGLVYRMLQPYLKTTGQPDAHPTAEEVKAGKLTGYFTRGATNFPLITANRALNTFFLPLGEGFLFSVGVGVNAASTKPGQTYINVRLASAGNPAAPESAMLIAGYASTHKDLTWPLSPLVSPLEGFGWTQVLTPANPGAGAEIVITVPTSARWRLKSLTYVLTTSATVATRFSNLVIDDGVNTFFQSVNTNGQAASLSFRYNTSPNIAAALDATNSKIAYPMAIDLVIPGGGRIRTATNNLQAGDQYSGIVLEVEEWIDF